MAGVKKYENRWDYGLCTVSIYRHDETQTAPASFLDGRLRGEFIQSFSNVKNFSFPVQSEIIEAPALGCNTATPAVENGAVSGEVSFTATQSLNVRLIELLFNTTLTDAPDAANSISALINKVGTVIQNAVSGIASIALIAGSQNIKHQNYSIKNKSATTIDIIGCEDGIIYASNLTIAGTGGTTDIVSIGVRLTGGSGTISFGAAIDQEAQFNTKLASTNKYSAPVTDQFTGGDFFLVVRSQSTQRKQSTNMHIPRVRLSGGQFNLESKTFHENTLTGTVYPVNEVIGGQKVLFVPEVLGLI